MGITSSLKLFGQLLSLVLIFLAIILIFGYISLFLKDFVVPVMYKNRVGVLPGGGNFCRFSGSISLSLLFTDFSFLC